MKNITRHRIGNLNLADAALPNIYSELFRLNHQIERVIRPLESLEFALDRIALAAEALARSADPQFKTVAERFRERSAAASPATLSDLRSTEE